ncbi:MAG: ABC transporter permease [Candidatus Omnitrophica bacterium]|nr:ABC transporter permease [Candidatus Omnitrophota bacterium]MCB9747989.1 ABC transporter permease [Candidatus Omnitrophota bacterium]
MNFSEKLIAYSTIVRKEVHRFMRIWTQTILPPAITQSLYFLIFGKFIGSQLRDIGGVSYMAFIVPGLVMMTVINNSFSNVASSFFSSKFQRSIEELLVSPLTNVIIVAGYITGGLLRGIICGVVVFCVSMFFIHPTVMYPGLILIFMILASIVFALGGLLNAIYAKSFDEIGIFPMFILLPLTYLGGVFYSIHTLPVFWQTVSKINPILYLVNGFRFGFYGISDVSINVSIAMLITFIIVLVFLNLYLLNKGTGLKS